MPAYVIFTDRTLIEMAETRPVTLDDMARISGVGATKLERHGDAFLSVITGEMPEEVHPARRKLAGRGSGEIFDRLLAVQADLTRGESGFEKPITCSSSQLAKVAEVQPGDIPSLTRLLGERRAERFGDAFLGVLKEAG